MTSVDADLCPSISYRYALPLKINFVVLCYFLLRLLSYLFSDSRLAINIYYTVYFILIAIIRRRVQNLLPCMRNTQMNSVVYGGTFDSIHLYFLQLRVHQKAKNNLKQNNIKTYLTIFYSQNRKSALYSYCGISEWLLFKAKKTIWQTRTNYILLKSWCLFCTRTGNSVCFW